MNIDLVNTYAARHTIIGWFVGLAYFNWFAHQPPTVPLWGHLLLIIVGMFAASIIIGGGMALVAAGVTRLVKGQSDASPDLFAWGAFISPVLAFFAAGYALEFFSPNSN